MTSVCDEKRTGCIVSCFIIITSIIYFSELTACMTENGITVRWGLEYWTVFNLNVVIKCGSLSVCQIVYCVKFYAVCYNKERTWFRSCTHMNGVIIYIYQ